MVETISANSKSSEKNQNRQHGIFVQELVASATLYESSGRRPPALEFVDMKPLKNRYHEIFAQKLATGAPLLNAYLSAGYKSSSSARYNASRLRNSPAVRERVNELLAQSAKRRRGIAQKAKS